ncbi:MAG: trypsin-like peptidase domain-containing protein [Christensenellales bacterium]
MRYAKRMLRAMMAAVFACALVPALALASVGSGGAGPLQQSPVTVKDVSASIFRIATIDENGTVITLGTGFALGDSAPVSYVATSNHVIEEYKDNIMVWMNRDHFVSCSVAISLSQVDVAVLKLEKPINKPPLPIGSSEIAAQGDQIYTFGFPDYDITDRNTAYPGDVTITTGTISKKTKLNDIEYYQVDATVNPGNSGGPLFHKESGSVIGIITIKSTVSDDINGAVYIERLIEALDLESIPYTMIGDFTQGSVQQGEITASPEQSQESESLLAPLSPDEQQRGDTYDMLLKIGIALAALAIALLIVALFLRMKDKKTEEAERDEARPSAPVAERSNAGYRAEISPRPMPMPSAAFGKGGATVAPLQEKSAVTKRVEERGPAKRPVVRAMSGFFAGGVVPVGSQVLIGRDASTCQLVYPMDMTSISRRHVRIAYDMRSGRFEITDLSTNGTFREGGKRLEKGSPIIMEAGAEFYLSDKEEMFRLDLEEI